VELKYRKLILGMKHYNVREQNAELVKGFFKYLRNETANKVTEYRLDGRGSVPRLYHIKASSYSVGTRGKAAEA